MAFKIIWSPLAEKTFESIIEYLNEEWTIRQVENFINRTESAIHLLEKNPYLFRSSIKENIHEVVITKHNLLLYQIVIESKRVELLAFFDTRQNPKKKLSKR